MVSFDLDSPRLEIHKARRQIIPRTNCATAVKNHELVWIAKTSEEYEPNVVKVMTVAARKILFSLWSTNMMQCPSPSSSIEDGITPALGA